MILTRAPLRVSFMGGNSDVPEFFLNEPGGGTVISTTIDKAVYVAVNRTPNDHIKVSYNDTEIVKDVNDLKHDRVREALKLYNIKSNIEISSFADIPSAGSGLGSSSAFTVALLMALREYKKKDVNPFIYSNSNIFKDSLKVEIDLCKNNIGHQDQAASFYGGFNQFWFSGTGCWKQQLESEEYHLDTFQKHLMMFRVGATRDTNEVLSSTPHVNKHEMIRRLVEITYEIPNLLKNKLYAGFGNALNESWMIKRETNALVTNTYIDDVYGHAIRSGALGGKLCGAGAGGHLLLLVYPHMQEAVESAMKDWGIERFPFSFSTTGARVLYAD